MTLEDLVWEKKQIRRGTGGREVAMRSINKRQLLDMFYECTSYCLLNSGNESDPDEFEFDSLHNVFRSQITKWLEVS